MKVWVATHKPIYFHLSVMCPNIQEPTPGVESFGSDYKPVEWNQKGKKLIPCEVCFTKFQVQVLDEESF
jgi:hypothetical protein